MNIKSEEEYLKVVPDELPVLPLKDVVVFPGTVMPLVVVGDSSIKLIDDALVGSKLIALFLDRSQEEEPSKHQLAEVGTVCHIIKMLRLPDGSVRILVQGMGRCSIRNINQVEPYIKAKIEIIKTEYQEEKDIEALKVNLINKFSKLISKIPYLPDELQIMVMNITDPAKVSDLIASSLNIPIEEKQTVLETLDVKKRLVTVSNIVDKNLEIIELGSKIQEEVKAEIDKGQREYILRQQLKAIQKELGEKDEKTAEIEELEKKIMECGMPEAAMKEAKRELDRLKIIPIESAEHTVVRTYLDWLVSMPWNKSTEDNLDITRARKILDEDHYGLKKVKDRILEFLAVRKLKSDSKGPILCFVGPPGTGKTSLGKSIARAMGRKFVRMSLGGVRDEAEMRGHRRTYIGALPGRIIQNIKNAGTKNPVFMLDEIDKLGSDFRGDPSSALLEILDPEQNNSFVDHYLDVPFDLSQVMFITTANVLYSIPAPLLDRMEVIELPGYTEEEKIKIAKKYLIPRQKEENGLKPKDIKFSDSAVRKIINGYTREAGLRNLEREIGSVCRKAAMAITEGAKTPITVTAENISDYLGPEKYFSEIADRINQPGVAVGLAWTPVGGEILFVESTIMKGKKGLTLTGSLGDVMKESAIAALSFIRSKSDKLGVKNDIFDNSDIHIHVPAGAIPKDGPSAGITIATSLYSLLTGRRVRSDIAMTGEITLRGKVLPIGGVKDKVLAAHRAGIKTVILPEKNEKDLVDVPADVKKKMKFIFVKDIEEVFAAAFNSRRNNNSKKRKDS
ncbi:MAG: endopeptidase La [Candidatus Schekmanbacteria bacterium]|nr:MAG: endopeptidase La [Candidatus Schekmanbacteria bacterium]